MPNHRSVSLGAIQVGERRREDYGDIAGLAHSIDQYGLLHPPVVDDELRLVAGGRRVEACKHLGWESIDVRSLGELTDAERREIELEENLRRKDLTSYERNKTLVQLTETAAAVSQQETCADSAQVVERKPGPIRTPGSLRDVSQRIGVPVKTIHDAQQHVKTAEQFPFLQGPQYKQYHVLQVAEQLERLPEEERTVAVKLIENPQITPQAAIPIVANLAQMPTEERQRVYLLNESNDKRDRDLALTTVVKTPPMPDPRFKLLEDALTSVRKAVRMFPVDPEVPQLEAIVIDLRSVVAAIEARRLNAESAA